MMKKRAFIAAAAFASVLLASCVLEFDPNNPDVEQGALWLQSGSPFTGTIEGTGSGYNGDVSITVGIAAGLIQTVVFDAPQDTPSYVAPVRTLMIPFIIASNGFEVDTISGSTVTSEGVLEAGRNAITTAGLTR